MSKRARHTIFLEHQASQESSASTMVKDKDVAPNDGKTTKLKPDDYKCIMDWLEAGGKDRLLGAGKTKIGEQNKSKRDGLKDLAEAINQNQKRDSNLVTLDASSMKNRWSYYYKKYRETRKRADTAGFGVTDDDIKMGISTVEQKLEFLCPQYARIDAMFGDRVNVDPLGFEETTIVADSATEVTREEEGPEVLTILDEELDKHPEAEERRGDSERESTPTTHMKDLGLDSARPTKLQKRIPPESARDSMKSFQLSARKANKDPRMVMCQTFIECNRDRVKLSEEKMKWRIQCQEAQNVLERERLEQQKLMERERIRSQQVMERERIESQKVIERERLDLDREKLRQSMAASRASFIQSALGSGKTMDEIKELLSMAFT